MYTTLPEIRVPHCSDSSRPFFSPLPKLPVPHAAAWAQAYSFSVPGATWKPYGLDYQAADKIPGEAFCFSTHALSAHGYRTLRLKPAGGGRGR